MTYIGKPLPKKDSIALVKGEGRFIDDIVLPKMLYAGFVRSPYAHALIKKVDVSDALRDKHVVAAWALKDIKPFINPYPPPVGQFAGLEVKHAELYPLASDRVRFVGEPVAFVVCSDRYSVEDAIEKISVDYEPLKPIVDPEEALTRMDNLLYPEWGDNVMMKFTIESGDIGRAFKEADIVIDSRIETQRFTGTPIECRGYVAQFEPTTNSLTVWASTQQPHPLRAILAELLNMPESLIRVIQPQVGGAFGLKIPPYREEPVVALAALRLRRAVKWVENRSEHMIATGHSKHQIHYLKIAAKKDGQVLGLEDKVVVDLGVYNATRGIMQAYNAAKMLPGPYRIRHLKITGYGVVTNKTHYQAYRGFGKDSASIVYERVMDLVADELNLDRIEVRFKNLIQPDEMPYVTATGAEYDSGNYPLALKTLVDIMKEFKADHDISNKKVRGKGVAFVVEPCASAFYDSFTQATDTTYIHIDLSGKVTVKTGVTSPGNGNETSIAQVVAETLGVKFEYVYVVQGDTAVCPYGIGNNSSRSSVVGTSSAYLAAREMRAKILDIASYILECSVADLEINDGVISVRGSDKKITVKDVARYVYRRNFILPRGIEPILEVSASYKAPNVNWVKDEKGRLNTYAAYSYAAFGVEVELDKETGQISVPKVVVVDDCGRVINPVLVDGQIAGGIVQGLGGALYEHLAYDNDGNLLTASLMDYLIPTALESPQKVVVKHLETPSPHTPLGSKGVGETGIMVMPAIISAVEDALRKLGSGVKLNKTPLTPEYILRLSVKR
jgi:carbon-monoxide dehydrogenase large subunit